MSLWEMKISSPGLPQFCHDSARGELKEGIQQELPRTEAPILARWILAGEFLESIS
jgi:hypothetical protein